MRQLSLLASEIPASDSPGRFIAVSGADLNAAVEPVDTAHMIASETELLRENPSWLAVLQAYVVVIEDLVNAEAQPETADGAAVDAEEPHAQNEPAAGGVPEDAASDGNNSQAPQKARRSQPWVPRLTSVAGVESEELSKIHGRLIAYGLLKCDLADRSAGVVYQLTREARRAIVALNSADTDGHADDDGTQEFSRSA